MNNYTMNLIESQDKVDKELKQRFAPKRKDSVLLAESYTRLYCKLCNDNREAEAQKYLSRFARVDSCGTFLEFGKTALDEFKLNKANFCRDRLCPMCSWRRTYKIFAQVSQIMDVIESDYRFLFLTLTVPNCSGSELPDAIQNLQKGFMRMFDRNKCIKRAICGYFKALEVTHDTNRLITAKMYEKAKKYYDNLGLGVGSPNPNYNKYHPHYHVILAVKPSYFDSRDYIKRDEWLKMWQKAMNDPSITQVDIRTCKNKTKLTASETKLCKKLSSAVAEVAKYSVKSADYIVHNDIDMTDSAVESLTDALSGRRLCTLGGLFRKTLQALKLDDMEDGDLVHVDGQLRSDLFIQLYRFEWSCGTYKLIEIVENL